MRVLRNIMAEPSGWSSGNVMDICIHDIVTSSVGFNYNSWIRFSYRNEQEGSEGEAGHAESRVVTDLLASYQRNINLCVTSVVASSCLDER